MKKPIIKGIFIFFLSYPVLLAGWLYLQDPYGLFMVNLGAELASFTSDWNIHTEILSNDNIKCYMEKFVSVTRGSGKIEASAVLSPARFTFNVPLTFAMILGLWPIFRWNWRIFLEAVVILIGVHLVFTYSFFGLQMYYADVRTGTSPNLARQFFWEFLFGFTDNMLIRFEPFLVSAYLWLRKGTGEKD